MNFISLFRLLIWVDTIELKYSGIGNVSHEFLLSMKARKITGLPLERVYEMFCANLTLHRLYRFHHFFGFLVCSHTFTNSLTNRHLQTHKPHRKTGSLSNMAMKLFPAQEYSFSFHIHIYSGNHGKQTRIEDCIEVVC